MTILCDERKPGTIIFSGSFDPPGNHSVITAKALARFAGRNDEAWIIPYGGRPGKQGLSTPRDRRQMILCAFEGIQKVIVDFMDLGRNEITPNVDMDRHFKRHQPERAVWHVVGSNMITGGASKQSKIQLKWKEGLWAFENLYFIILVTPGVPFNPIDLPPNYKLLEVDAQATSQDIRNRVSLGESIDDLVPPKVLSYIRTNGLYLPNSAEM